MVLVLGVLLGVLLLLLLLELVLVLFSARSDVGVLFREETDDTGCDFMVDDRLVVLADDVNAEFLRTSSAQ